jgi:hypothetical protein
VGPRVALSGRRAGGDAAAVRNRERTTRDGLDVVAYQDLFASPPCGREGGQSEGRGSPGHGGAYLRVIPEGRTPSAWDPPDNVPPRFALYPRPYTGCRSYRIDCTLRRDASSKNVKVKARIELGMLKGVLPCTREDALPRRRNDRSLRSETLPLLDLLEAKRSQIEQISRRVCEHRLISRVMPSTRN